MAQIARIAVGADAAVAGFTINCCTCSTEGTAQTCVDVELDNGTIENHCMFLES